MEQAVTDGFRISVDRLSHSYRDGGTLHDVLANVTFTLEPGDVLSILGTNGSGKTTLLSCIAGLLSPTEGSITIESTSSVSAPEPKIALLHQDYRQTNFPWASALENVTYPLRFSGVSSVLRNARGADVLSEFLPEVQLKRKAYELSGGQQQLLAIARALAAAPHIVLGDEPLSAIDSIRGIRAIQAIQKAMRTSNFNMIWISHDVDEALLLGDSVGLLSRQKRTFERIIKNPIQSPRTPTDLVRPELARLKAEILDFLLSDSAKSKGRNVDASS